MKDVMYQDKEEEEEEGEPRKSLNLTTTFNKLYNNWPSSRIIRVSRASGGKDRHSKVLTSRGLRDRRVRLSVGTAIQFYDLQDRLGYDQPSKAVEWLLRAAASSIDELPPINSPFFPDTPNQNQISDDKSSSRRSDKADVIDNMNNNSTTEDSVKGCSELSLSRSDSRVRRARERANKERELLAETKKVDDNEEGNCNNNEYFRLNPNYYVSRTSSFTELLNNGRMNNDDDIIADNHSHNKQWDHYFTNGLMDPNGVCAAKFTSSPMEIQYLSSNFAQDLMDPVGNCNENNSLINFAISSSSSSSGAHSSSSGFNRGTLQSNSQSFMPQSQHRFNPQDGFFFLGSSMQVENNNHEFDLSGFDARLQLSYGDDHVHASNGSHKAKGKK